MSRWRTTLACMLAPVLLAGGCAKKSTSHSATAEPPPVRANGSLAEYEADLLRNEQALMAQGVVLRARSPKSITPEAAMGAAANGQTEGDGDSTVASDIPGGGEAEPSEESSEREGADAPAPSPAPTQELERDELREKRAKRSDREKDAVSPRCEMICTLAENTCELESKICSLAERNSSDPRYDDACDRAGDDCSVAQEACFACSG